MSGISATSVSDVLTTARKYPVQFMDTMWPGAEAWQKAALASVWKWPRTAIVSANGAGKTWGLSRISITHLLTYPDSVVVTTAGTWTQVRRQVWGEIADAHHALPPWLQFGNINDTDWKLSRKWYALGLSTDRVEHFEGFHSPHTLVVVDEAKVMTQGTLDAINRIFSGRGNPKLLVASSTGEPRGPLYEIFKGQEKHYARMKVSPFECWLSSPGAPPGEFLLPPTKALKPGYIEQMRDLYGEDSPQFKSMVMAEWAEDVSSWCLFPPSVIRDMRDPYEGEKIRPEVWVGADVARSVAGDESVFYAVLSWSDGEGREHYEPCDMLCFRTSDSVEYANLLMRFCERWGVPPERVNIDGTGIGGPVCDFLAERGFRVNNITFSESPEMEVPRMARMRDQLWWQTHVAGRERRIHSVTDDITLAQFAEPRYGYDSLGRLTVEPKETTAKRVSQSRPRSPWQSPDRSDSFNLAVHRPFTPVRPVSLGELKDFY